MSAAGEIGVKAAAGPGPSPNNEMKKRDPYDISTWGPECARGIQYRDQGPVVAGQAGAIRKLGGSRKA